MRKILVASLLIVALSVAIFFGNTSARRDQKAARKRAKDGQRMKNADELKSDAETTGKEKPKKEKEMEQEEEPEEEIPIQWLTLDPKNYDWAMSHYKNVLVTFHSAHCKPCDKLIANMKKAARILANDTDPAARSVKMASVHALHTPLLRRFRIYSFPHSMFYVKGKHIFPFGGGKVPMRIVKWIKKKLSQYY